MFFCCITTLGELSADFCGVERSGFTSEQVDFAPVPEHRQDGPFYSTSTPMEIWRITSRQAAADPFAF